MRMWIWLAALTVAAVVVGSAGASAPAVTHHVPTGTAIYGGWAVGAPTEWFTVDAAGNITSDQTTAVPAGLPIIIGVTWVGEAYGHTKAVPQAEHFKLTLSKGDQTIVQQTWEQGDEQWTQVFPWDEYWLTMLGPVPPFNSHMGTATYGIDWEYSLPDGLAAGLYHVEIDEQFTHTYNDLSAYGLSPARPGKITPFAQTIEFDIVVA